MKAQDSESIHPRKIIRIDEACNVPAGALSEFFRM